MSDFFEPEGARPVDPLRAVVAAIEHGTYRLLLDAGTLPPSFFDLSTGVAGDVVQKLVNYGVRMAAVVPELDAHSVRFQEFAREANRFAQFRFFATRAEAVAWLTAT
jgi:hypothetical protein